MAQEAFLVVSVRATQVLRVASKIKSLAQESHLAAPLTAQFKQFEEQVIVHPRAFVATADAVAPAAVANDEVPASHGVAEEVEPVLT